jgi:pimeloyl-ACP methyl ester carboxylesterase
VVFPGVGMTNANPTGIQRWGEVRLLSPLARAFTVYRVGRRVGLKPKTTMADLANDYAVALEEELDGPVDVLGISTGGSIALQLAVDKPTMLRRLVVAGAAYRLSEYGREFQRRTAELSAAGDRRGLARMQAPDVTDSRLGRWIAGGLLWLATASRGTGRLQRSGRRSSAATLTTPYWTTVPDADFQTTSGEMTAPLT